MSLSDTIKAYYEHMAKYRFEAEEDDEPLDAEPEMDAEGGEAPKAPKAPRAPRKFTAPPSKEYNAGIEKGIQAAKQHLGSGQVYSPYGDSKHPEEALGYHHAYHHTYHHGLKAAQQTPGVDFKALEVPSSVTKRPKISPELYSHVRDYHNAKTHEERSKALEGISGAITKEFGGEGQDLNRNELIGQLFQPGVRDPSKGLRIERILKSALGHMNNAAGGSDVDQLLKSVGSALKRERDAKFREQSQSKEKVSYSGAGREGEEGGALAASQATVKQHRGAQKSADDMEALQHWFGQHFPHKDTEPGKHPPAFQHYLDAPFVEKDSEGKPTLRLKSEGSFLMQNRPEIFKAALRSKYYDKDGNLLAPGERPKNAEVAKALLANPEFRRNATGGLVKPIEQLRKLPANAGLSDEEIEKRADVAAAKAISVALSDFDNYKDVHYGKSSGEAGREEGDRVLSQQGIRGASDATRAPKKDIITKNPNPEGGKPEKEPLDPDVVKALGEPPPLPGQEPDAKADPEAHHAWRAAKLARDKWDLDKDVLLHQKHGKLQPPDPQFYDYPPEALERIDASGNKLRGKKPYQAQRWSNELERFRAQTDTFKNLKAKQQGQQQQAAAGAAPPAEPPAPPSGGKPPEAPAPAQPAQQPQLPDDPADATPEHGQIAAQIVGSTPQPAPGTPEFSDYSLALRIAKRFLKPEEIRALQKQAASGGQQAAPPAQPQEATPETPPAPGEDLQAESLGERLLGGSFAKVVKLTEWTRVRKG